MPNMPKWPVLLVVVALAASGCGESDTLAMANAVKNAAIVRLLINAGAVPTPKDGTAQTHATPAQSRP
jgi:hypothetical protein